ncbi:hypothetical protein GL263_27590, partial [Streptomyces durbertensis]|nr:hypothetical protein [Streptomyces durbertensis]
MPPAGRPDPAALRGPAYHPDGPLTPPPCPPADNPPHGPAATGSTATGPGRGRGRLTAVALCLVLGAGLLGGAAAGTWLTGSETERAAGFHAAAELWREIPVDDLFPRELRGDGAGPGGADRRWTRLAAAPDGNCKHAFDELLARALSPVGCRRLVRATYVDETTTSVTTVGMVFT